MSEIEDTIQRIKTRRTVKGVVIVNNEGNIIRSTFKDKEVSEAEVKQRILKVTSKMHTIINSKSTFYEKFKFMQQFQDPENLSTNSMASKSYITNNYNQFNQYEQNTQKSAQKIQYDRSRTPQRQSNFPTTDKKILGELKQNFQYLQPDLSQNMGLSPENLIQKLERDNGDLMKYNLEEINRELDHNMNETIILLNRRKALIQQKRKKMMINFAQKMDQIKHSEIHNIDISFATSNVQIQQLISSISSVTKINKQIMKISKNEDSTEKHKVEQEKSQEFWNSNKYFEDQIDNLLQRLKFYDQELEKNNSHVTEFCKNLDSLEDQIRDLLLSKSIDHVQKAEPLYQTKQQINDALQQQINQRNQIKDEKISLIYSIINNLGNLKDLRQQRLQELVQLFGFEENIESTLKMQYFVEFVDQLENLAKIKEISQQIESTEEMLKDELETIARQNEQMFSDLIRRQSEEARLFGEYSESLKKRENIQKGVSYFCSATGLNKLPHFDIKEVLIKFKENIIFMKPLVEEDQAIKQGLNKTCETIQTFNNMLKQIENEKTKRKELVYILESCSKLKQEEENQTETLRQCEMDITKKQQQKLNLEEDLENILTEADLGQYKKLGLQIQNYENELMQLSQQKMFIQNELDELNKEVNYYLKRFICK